MEQPERSASAPTGPILDRREAQRYSRRDFDSVDNSSALSSGNFYSSETQDCPFGSLRIIWVRNAEFVSFGSGLPTPPFGGFVRRGSPDPTVRPTDIVKSTTNTRASGVAWGTRETDSGVVGDGTVLHRQRADIVKSTNSISRVPVEYAVDHRQRTTILVVDAAAMAGASDVR